MMSGWSFLGQLCLGSFAIIAAVYIPGRLLLRILRVETDSLEHLTAALVGGAGFLTLLYWILLMLRIPGSLWIYVVVCSGLEGYFSYQQWQREKNIIPDPDAPQRKTLTAHWPLGLLMLAGMVIQLRFTVTTGWIGNQGVSLLAWHAHDAPWHIYNLYQAYYRFPLEMPGFAGEALHNYHIFSDLFWGAILRLVRIDAWHCYFRIAPPFYSGLLVLSMFVTARRWSGRIEVGYLASGLTLFCSNFGYLMPLFFGWDKYFIWDSIFWVQSPATMIFNPGVSFSFSVFMLGLWALIRWTREKQGFSFLLLLGLLWGVLPGFKVYPALLVVAGLSVSGSILWLAQRSSKQWQALAAVLPLFLLVFLPANLKAPSLVRFLPGFNLGSMLVAPDRMLLMTSSQLKVLFVEKPWMVVLIMAGLALIFLIGNLGVRVLGLLPLLRACFAPKQADPILIFMAVVIGGAWAVPLLFVQEGVPWNTVQFFYYAVLVSALPAAGQFWNWIQHLRIHGRYVLILLLFFLGVPGIVQAWLVIRWEFRANAQVCAGLCWLRSQARLGEVILRPLPDLLLTEEGYNYWKRSQTRGRMTRMQEWKEEAANIADAADKTPANAHQETESVQPGSKQTQAKTSKAQEFPSLERTDAAVVAGLALRNTFLEDTVSSQIMGFPVEKRLEAVRAFYTDMDVVEARNFLENGNIIYVLLFSGQKLPFNPEGIPLIEVFKNESIIILKHVYPGML